MSYNRPWMSFPEQLQQLVDRGLGVTDTSAATAYLDRIGYYRLSGYWYPFRQNAVVGTQRKLDEFVPGSQFSDAVDLYVFDKKLRLLVLDALERIEVAIRVDIAHLLGKQDTFAYQDSKWFDGKFTQRQRSRNESGHEQWLKRYDVMVRRSKETFIKHYKDKYGLPLPFWVAIEIWDFGTMSILFAGLKGRDRNDIGEKYGVPDGRVFSSWLRSLNHLRNLCAHHCRLWNRNIVDQAKLPPAASARELSSFIGKPDQIARPFLYLCLIQWLMLEICPNSQWHERFKALLASFPEDSNQRCSLAQMGCPAGWEDWELWQ